MAQRTTPYLDEAAQAAFADASPRLQSPGGGLDEAAQAAFADASPRLQSPGGGWRALAGLFLAALALRLLVFGYLAPEPRKFYTYDSDGYERRALNLLHYGQFASEAAPPLSPDLDRTPVYPLYLAALIGLTGQRPLPAVLLQVLLGSLTPVALYLLARELRLPHGAGLLAGLAVALDPVSALSASRLLTETIFTLLVVLGALLLARHLRTLGPGWSLAAAVALALAALTRPIAQLLPIVLLPLYAFATNARPNGRATLGEGRLRSRIQAAQAAFVTKSPRLQSPGGRRQSALVGAALLLVVSMGLTYSWAYRNYRVAGTFTLSTISDTNLIYYRARAVLADVARISQDEAWGRLEAQVAAAAPAGAPPAEILAAQRRIAIDLFLRHPGATAAMLLKGVGRMLIDPGYTLVCTALDRSHTNFDCFPGTSSMNEPGMLGKALGRAAQMSPPQLLALGWSAALLGALYLSAIVGLAALLRERRWLALVLLLLLAGYFVGLAAGAEANSRFRIPALPFIALIAGHGAHRLLARHGARDPADQAASLARRA